MEDLIEYLEGVKHSEIKNPPDRNPRKNNSDGLQKTNKHKCKRDEDGESHNVTANTTSMGMPSCTPPNAAITNFIG
eukprot:10688052-Ditylum_brightwellii.AAC.1